VTSQRLIAKTGFEYAEDLFDRAFGPAWNPLYYLGALGYFFYWIVAVSGIYLYIVFDTSVTGAYQSVEYLTHTQWYAGGVMRSLHRYASDALVVVMMLHLLREFVMDRYRGVRWFSWFTGVPILWFVFASGISGYWLVWDILAQYIAIATTEWFDALPIFGEPVARNFLNQGALSGRFFTLMVFLHIAVPLILLFIMWIHLQRMSRAKVNPPRGLAAGSLIMMLGLSLAYPAVSQAPANLDVVPAVVGLDWFYLLFYPLTDFVPGLWIWGGFALVTLLLVWMPWLPPQRRPPIAVVDLEHCNGCGRCVADCPFNALTMQPRSDGRPFAQEAVVTPDLCISCGICVGACPPSTPFRRTRELATGIDLPDLSLKTLRDKTLEAAGKLSGEGRVIVYGCGFGAELAKLEGSGVAVVSLPCTAMVAPSFLDFVITRHHAEGVMLAGCRNGDCHYRLGITWMDQRIARQRDPYLRQRVPRERVATSWAGLVPHGKLEEDLAAFRARLKALGPYEREAPATATPRRLEVAETGDGGGP
jgi:quinol-cytochrome oxidoreductase complex cytochrome b subunit/coenzyme F420-reducing hydrogenase delta subunit